MGKLTVSLNELGMSRLKFLIGHFDNEFWHFIVAKNKIIIK